MMHDIWNPWHGCKKISEGCEHCYMYYLDRKRDQDGSHIYQTAGFTYPLSTNRDGTYKIQSGETLRVCMTSDFFLEEADAWREDVWSIISKRRDIKFFILTKRADRMKDHMPASWKEGWEHVMMNVTAENQIRADERIPLLLELPAKHKGIMIAPMVGPVSIEKYLATGLIEEVTAGGENYGGQRALHFEWIQSLRKECEKYHVTFTFIETGTHFVKDGKHYKIEGKRKQALVAYRSQMNYQGNRPVYHFYDPFDNEIAPSLLYHPVFYAHCEECASKPICNGCSLCNACGLIKK